MIATRDSASTGLGQRDSTWVRRLPRVTLALVGPPDGGSAGSAGQARVVWDSATVIVDREGWAVGDDALTVGRRVTAASVPTGPVDAIRPPEFLASRIVIEDP